MITVELDESYFMVTDEETNIHSNKQLVVVICFYCDLGFAATSCLMLQTVELIMKG